MSDTTKVALEQAGWHPARIQPQRVWCYAGGAGTTPDVLARDFVLPHLAAQLAGAPEGVADAVQRAVAADLQACWDGTGIRLDAMVATVTARRTR